MARRDRDAGRHLRRTVDALPQHTKEAMLRGIDSNRIIVGAYVDSRSGGVCPMLAAHRNGGRTTLGAFARAWDEYTAPRRPRRATRREVSHLRALLQDSLGRDRDMPQGSITELAAQLRAERQALARNRPAVTVPRPEMRITRQRPPRGEDLMDILAATEEGLFEQPADGPVVRQRDRAPQS